MVEFARFPEVQTQLYDEYKRVMQDKDTDSKEGLSSRDLSSSKMPKLFEFIDEVLMRHAPAPVIARRMTQGHNAEFYDADEDRVVRVEFKKNDLLTFPLAFLTPHSYNPNPYLAREDKDAAYEDRKKMILSFANGSKHECVGQHLGKYLLAVLIARLMEKDFRPGLVKKFEGFDDTWLGTYAIRAKIPLKLYTSQTDFTALPTFNEGDDDSTNGATVSEPMQEEDSTDQLTSELSKLSMDEPTKKTTTLRKRPVVHSPLPVIQEQ